MPHIVLRGRLAVAHVVANLQPSVERWGRAVLKTEGCWVNKDASELLVEGVVVELSRPLHPVALVAPRDNDTVVRLWRLAPVERTRAVQRWLVALAVELQRHGAGPVVVTNIPADIRSGSELCSSVG
jgi:hypothetical protein